MEVTVCIATYNRDFKIIEAVDSLLTQSNKDFEIIIVNDGSKDKTAELLQKYKNNQRITIINHSYNKGLAAARNTAIDNAKGKYFSFIDDDDKWDSRFIDTFLEEAKRYDENYVFICGHKSYTKNNEIDTIPNKYDGLLKDYIKIGYTPPVAAQFYSTSLLKKIAGYNSQIDSGVDHDLWLTLSYCDVRIKTIQSALVIKNNDFSFDRMTTNYQQRMNKIQKSLELWKKNIVLNYSECFYHSFCQNYYFNIEKKIFSIALYNRYIKQMYYVFKNSDYKFRLLKSVLINYFNHKYNSIKRKISKKSLIINYDKPLFKMKKCRNRGK